MKNVAIIGSGQLGTRHLQSLSLVSMELNIWVVDPNQVSLDMAKSRWEEMKPKANHRLNLLTKLNEVSTTTNFDLVVIATNSNIRHNVVVELLDSFTVSFLVLEKFLFPRIEEYDSIQTKLSELNTVAFVNCPRRMYSEYKEIRNTLRKSKGPINMEVVGNNWGLGCNGIHFIDLFNFLSDETIETWENQLDDGFLSSKREGYVEFSGAVTGRTSENSSLKLVCYKSGYTNLSIRISSPTHQFIISESKGIIMQETITATSVETEQVPFVPKYQSQLTNLVAQEFFESERCELTPYATSSKLHKPYLTILLNHYNQFAADKTNTCPIT